MSGHDGWVLYGAYGYTGTLIAEACAARGLRPLLAGRKAGALRELATRLGLPHLVLELGSGEALREALGPLQLVLNCAGPFSRTARPMLEAALGTGTHYLDITGEVDVFQMALSQAATAREAGVVVCPGVGFDVVPTDCVAATLIDELPDGVRLALGFDSRSKLSPGTSRTSLEGLAAGARSRIDGRLQPVALGSRTRQIDFGAGEKLAMAITWGDLVTAAATTGIGDIDVYVPVSPRALKRLRRLALARPLLMLPGAQALVGRLVAANTSGPTQAERRASPSRVWGEIENAAGERRVARLTTANGYDVTVEAALAITQAVLANQPAGDYYTPSQLMGADFVCSLPGSSTIEISTA